MGTLVLRALTDRGCAATALSRRTGFDLQRSDPRDLTRALAQTDVVVDCSDAPDRRVATFDSSARALADAAARAGVGHLVLISIVGVDRPSLKGMSYYQGKLGHERALAAGTVPVSIVRSTQWYAFADQVYPSLPLGGSRFGLAPAMRMQPVANDAVARRLAAAALTPLPGQRLELAGPEVMSLADLIRRVWRARGQLARVAQVPIPGLKGFTDGALLPGPDAEIDSTTIAQWVANSH
jgi:uncharacterized protein YbjT (DUF2867 family)